LAPSREVGDWARLEALCIRVNEGEARGKGERQGFGAELKMLCPQTERGLN